MEMERFIGILIHMGIVNMPDFKIYWTAETLYLAIANVMLRERFIQIKGCFHISYNQDLIGSDRSKHYKLFKFRQLYDRVKNNCISLPSEEYNSVDDQMIPLKGKQSSTRQYNKAKPVKWGFKVFTRCGAKTGIITTSIYIRVIDSLSTSKI